MNSKTKTGIALMAIVFGLALSPALSNEADARVTLPDAILQNDFTAPKGDKPFGGVDAGNFYIHIKGDVTTIYAELDQRPSLGTVYEGWLVKCRFWRKDKLWQIPRLQASTPSSYD